MVSLTSAFIGVALFQPSLRDEPNRRNIHPASKDRAKLTTSLRDDGGAAAGRLIRSVRLAGESETHRTAGRQSRGTARSWHSAGLGAAAQPASAKEEERPPRPVSD